MWRALAVLGLLAALVGPFLRQAEAADDLARTLAALLCPCDIEPYDTGVGDEPELGACKTDSPTSALVHDPPGPSCDLQPASFASLAQPLACHTAACPSRHGAEPPRTIAERLAWLHLLIV